MIKRFVKATTVVFVALALGSCGNFAGFVSDNWPTWAGGMPKDVPPRPGAPGYAEFMAHQEGKDTPPAAATPAATAGPATAPPAASAPPAADQAKAQTQVAPSTNRPSAGRDAVEGGLY
jgi:hypothetical protein